MKLRYKDETHEYRLTLPADEAEAWGVDPYTNVRCKSVTKVAKVPEDTFNLERYAQRKLAVGLAVSPHLVESAAAHHTDKGKLNAIVKEALIAGGSQLKSEAGTTAHRITERIDQGDELIMTATAAKVRERWLGLLELAGIEIDASMVERCIVYPALRICGKLDRFGRVIAGGALAEQKPDLVGKLVTVDLKTGDGAVKYPHSTACQLALYSHAPLVAIPWAGIEGETSEFEPLPADLDPDCGVVVSMTDDESAIYELDLALAWRCVERIIFPALKWRAVSKGRLVRRVASL